MSLKKDIKNHYFGKYKKDYEAVEYKPRSPDKAVALEQLMGLTLEHVRAMSGRIAGLISRGKIENPHHYQHFKSAARLFSAESILTTVATSKLVVTPKISGMGISLYYMWNDSHQIYNFHTAKLDDPSIVEVATKEELDVTAKVTELVNSFSVDGCKAIPSYIHAAMFEEQGIALVREGQPNPKFLCVQVVLTIPALDMLGSDLTMPQLLRGWLNEPKEMVKESRPKFHIVAYNLKANVGFLSTEHLQLKGGASANRKAFTMTKRGIIRALGTAGFHTAIQSVDVDRLVRGMVMGVEHSSLEAYIVPALHSIRETNKRMSSLKTEKSIEAFKKTTLNKNDDLINLFNYLRNYPYMVEGLFIQPNYYIIAKELETKTECLVYLTPASASRIADPSTMEVMKTIDVSYADALKVISITGYNGTKNPLTKANIKLLAKEGLTITENMVIKFQNSIEDIRKIRERTEPTYMAKARDQLWDIDLKGAAV